MSILHGRDLLSSKYITAIITDSSNRSFFIPIKYTIGDYFITEIENQTYIFRIDGNAIHTYRDTLVKSFRMIFYSTAHYMPISDKTKLLELGLVKNNLPKVDMMLFNIFKILGKREKSIFESHKITDLKEWIEKRENDDKTPTEFLQQAKSIVSYLEGLKVSEIVTPLRKISEFIEDDLITTDPRFFGSLVNSIREADMEHRKVTNAPIKSKTAWTKIIAVACFIGLVGAIVYIAYENGAFDSLAGLGAIGEIDFSLGGAGSGSSSDLISKYPTPESMKAAVDRGELKMSQIPPDLRPLVESVKSPSAGTP